MRSGNATLTNSNSTPLRASVARFPDLYLIQTTSPAYIHYHIKI
jgi:hypothetical protein